MPQPKTAIARALRDIGELFGTDDRTREFMDGLTKSWGLDEPEPHDDEEEEDEPGAPRR